MTVAYPLTQRCPIPKPAGFIRHTHIHNSGQFTSSPQVIGSLVHQRLNLGLPRKYVRILEMIYAAKVRLLVVIEMLQVVEA
jgi:hypothetical protein